MKTWGGKSDFDYSGSVETGTVITYGKDKTWKVAVTAEHYRSLRKKFLYNIIPVGTSRTNPPKGSVGFWLQSNVTRTAIASYVAPILIRDGYAKQEGKHDIQIIK